MDRKRPFVTYALLGGAASLLVFGAVASPRHPIAPPPVAPIATPAPIAQKPPTARPQVELVFALDTTGSMSALLEGAKKKIWEITRFVAQGQPAPELRIGLIAYRDVGDEYVTRFYDLSDDLDAVYQNLSALSAGGGGDTPEHVAKALHEAVNRASWSPSKNTLRIIYLVGDAPPHTDYKDGFDYRAITRAAKERGIRINTIRCGADRDTEVAWNEIAGGAAGEYASIDQSGGVVDVNTPYDSELAALNGRLSATAYGYGSAARREAVREKAAAAAAAPAAVQAERAGFFGLLRGRGKAAAVSGGGDLLDDWREKRIDVNKLEGEALPEPMKAMNAEERSKFVADKSKEREEILSQINAVSQKRDAYLRAAKPAPATGFDAKVRASLKKQAKDIGVAY